MDEQIKKRLESVGVDVDDAMRRLVGNEKLFWKVMTKFAQDINMVILHDSMAGGDYQTAFRAVHSLKGVAGNLSVEKLMKPLIPVVEALRVGNVSEAEVLIPELDVTYDRIHKDILEVLESENEYIQRQG